MRRKKWWSYLFRKVPPLLLIVILGLSPAGAGLAQGPGPAAPPTPAPLGWGDEGIREVGVEWINDFPGTADDRSHWDESCDGLYYRLLDEGWTGRFRWTDWNAWETDFKNASRGGSENSYADNVDIAMICTHGSGAWDDFWSKSLSSVYFGSTHTDHHLVPGDAYQGYGDKDLEWLAFDSCSVLSDGGPSPYYNRGYWAATMNGLHLLLGFKNTMYVNWPGDGLWWGRLMTGYWFLPAYRVTQAWFAAVDIVQPNVTCARVLAEVQNNYNDYLHGEGYVSPDPVHNTIYWYWDHCSTHALLATTLQSTDQVMTMPILQVQPRQVDEDYVRDRIAHAFNMSGTLFMDDQFYYLTDATSGETETLQVDMASGGFMYHNLSNLWVPPPVTPTLLPEERAFVLLDQFFGQQGEGLPGAWYRNGGAELLTEQLVEVQMSPVGAAGQEKILATMPTNQAITYLRVIAPAVQTAAGSQQQTFPVVGPGARLKAYLGDKGEIIGMQGGSRDVMQTKADVEVIPFDDAWDMYLADPTIALLQVPWVADQITLTSWVLGYYEHPQFIPQAELIPVWIFTADFYAGGDLLAQGVPIYVPAAYVYMPPQVQIDSPAPDSTFLPGEAISFTGSVVQYGAPPFAYQWTASHDGFLGSGSSIVAALSPSVKGSSLYSQTVSLEVTDSNGQHGTATVVVFVRAAIYLPVVTRQW